MKYVCSVNRFQPSEVQYSYSLQVCIQHYTVILHLKWQKVNTNILWKISFTKKINKIPWNAFHIIMTTLLLKTKYKYFRTYTCTIFTLNLASRFFQERTPDWKTRCSTSRSKLTSQPSWVMEKENATAEWASAILWPAQCLKQPPHTEETALQM